MLATDIMAAGVASVSGDASMRHAIEIMLDRGISGLPVVDGEGNLVGIVTEGDLMTRQEIGQALMAAPQSPVTDVATLEKYLKAHSWRVGDVMTREVLTVSPQASVGQIADIFLSAGFKRVPVVTDGKLLGIVSRRDLLRATTFASPKREMAGDDAIEIAAHARLHSDLGMTPDDLPLSVRQGVVEVDTSSLTQLQRRAVECVVEGIPGATYKEARTGTT